jgi:F-type H+-transporting ATPase subunit epsilon
MPQTFNLLIVTPQAELYHENVSSVNVCGVEGDFAILAAHANFVSEISPGVISIYEHEHELKKQLFLYDGIADVQATRTIIFCSEAINVADINIDDIKSKVTALENSTIKDDKMLAVYQAILRDLDKE